MQKNPDVPLLFTAKQKNPLPRSGRAARDMQYLPDEVVEDVLTPLILKREKQVAIWECR